MTEPTVRPDTRTWTTSVMAEHALNLALPGRVDAPIGSPSDFDGRGPARRPAPSSADVTGRCRCDHAAGDLHPSGVALARPSWRRSRLRRRPRRRCLAGLVAG